VPRSGSSVQQKKRSVVLALRPCKVIHQCLDYTGIQHWELCAPT
jgi:hypothetical protein